MENASERWLGGSPPGRELDAADAAQLGAFAALERKVCAVLAAYAPLSPVFSQRLPEVCSCLDAGTVADQIRKSLRSAGLSIVVGIDGAEPVAAAPGGVSLSPVEFTVAVAEGVAVNRGPGGCGVTATRCAELAILALSGLPLANGVCAFRRLTALTAEAGVQAIAATFATALNLTDRF